MRIAYFTESLPPATDGVSRTFSNLIQTLESEQIDYRIYSPFKPNLGVSWSDRVRKVISVPFFLYSDYRLGIPYFHRLPAELDRFRPDIIHVASPTLLGLAGLNYAKRRSTRSVASYHTHFVSYFSYYNLRSIMNAGWRYLTWFHNQFDRTYAPSESAVIELEQHGIRRVEPWRRGVDTTQFSPAFRNEELRRDIGAIDKPVLLFVGRLVKEKDLHDLIEAYRILIGQGIAFKLVFVGDGPMRAELEMALPDAHFAGYQYGHRLSEWYASADLFVFPSTTETFGNVILESFASGLPAIGVRRGGVANLMTHGVNGLLTEPNCPAGFAEGIRSVVENPQKRKQMSEAAIETARQHCWDTVNRALLNSYAQLLLCNN